ncbi:hypothetical protein [Rugamonas aquatica]|uniref:Recombinase domain-containing protein n=1 Tax=Rugamonas aquatica TaxID=2743357 RepID=A0A6A7N3D3_9BURK|nr:hypothetical protein [Rugamonas aquatica]MQA39624.1 hypothetical protein [Rugamonas aquatica]
MSALHAPPTFGGKLNNDRYYEAVISTISALRPASSLRTIADHLTTAGFLTPSGLPWNRRRVSDFIRNTTTQS